MRTTTFSQWTLMAIAFCFQFILVHDCLANVKTAVGNTGNGWNAAGNWSPAGVPQDGDTVIIPTGFTLTVKGNIYGSTNPCLYIKIFGTLDFDPSGRIELCSGAGLSVMAGASIQSHGSSSEIIRIGGVVKYNGLNDGTLTGPAFASASTGVSPAGFQAGTLAIHLFSFTAKAETNTVLLLWKAASDHPLDRFRVQRSENGADWQTIAELPVTTVGSDAVSYQYNDPVSPVKTIYYRLTMLTADGRNTYSPIAAVNAGTVGIRTFPNPSVSSTTVAWEGRGSQPVHIILTDLRNATIRQYPIHPAQSFQVIETAGLARGQYLVTLMCADGTRHSNKLFVLK